MHTTTPEKPKKVTAAKSKETAAKSKDVAKSKETAAKSKKKAHDAKMSAANKRLREEVLKTVPYTQVNGGKFMHAL